MGSHGISWVIMDYDSIMMDYQATHGLGLPSAATAQAALEPLRIIPQLCQAWLHPYFSTGCAIHG